MYKLIIADDEPRILRGLKNCIPWNAIGFSLEGTAESGKQALNLAQKIRPHLIITDIRMPDMNGLEFISAVRSLGIHSQIIIVSGYNDFTYAQQAIRYGVSDYLLKPINEDNLYDCVIQCIQKLEIATVMNPNLKKLLPDEQPNNSNNLFIAHAKSYIASHYHEDINLKEVADHLGIHPNYLSNLFSRLCNESFLKYVCKIRISKAKELMQNPQLKVYEIAELVGYSDYRWFSKLFKQYEALTPQQYKSQYIYEEPPCN